jgi:hypothetical protein
MERAEGDCLLASLTLVERSEFKRERERSPGWGSTKLEKHREAP